MTFRQKKGEMTLLLLLLLLLLQLLLLLGSCFFISKKNRAVGKDAYYKTNQKKT